VSDTGVGIAPDQARMLFQRFSQLDESNTREFGGVGLGLSISKGLVGLMGGEIGLESVEGRGSTFWFTLPAPVAAEGEAAGKSRGHAKAGQALLRPLRILLVDDAPANRELIAALLSPFDVQVIEAANGVLGVDAAAQARFDIILMDLQMPVMDGLTATRTIRANSPLNSATPIVAISANVMAPQVAACLEAGANDHIAKPINPGELLNKISRWTTGSGAA